MNFYHFIRPILFRLDPEVAHTIVSSILRKVISGPIAEMVAEYYTVNDARLESRIFDLHFPNPVGLAAGFDKNAKMVNELASLGFGHIEIGAVTSHPQDGNDRPRLFRLEEELAIINRMGFNNEGAETISKRLAGTKHPGVPIGVNIGKLEDAPIDDAPKEYSRVYEMLENYGDYFVVNVSCPNIPRLRTLQEGENLNKIISVLQREGDKPILVKISPDMDENEIEETISVAEAMDVDGIIATNTSNTSRGGLSGKPIEEKATKTIRFIAERTDIPIIGVGGVSSADDAYEKIRAGASLIQLYTGLIYQGPSIARNINRGLLELLERDNFNSLQEAIGADLEEKKSITESVDQDKKEKRTTIPADD